PRHHVLAGRRIDREGRGVERRGVVVQVHDRARLGVEAVGVDRTVLVEGRERAAGRVDEVVDARQRVIRRVVDDVAAGSRRARGAGSAWLVGLVAVLDVVVHAGRFRGTAGHQGGATRVGVGRVGGRRVGVLAAGTGQPGQRRARVVGDVPVQVALVHT